MEMKVQNFPKKVDRGVYCSLANNRMVPGTYRCFLIQIFVFLQIRCQTIYQNIFEKFKDQYYQNLFFSFYRKKLLVVQILVRWCWMKIWEQWFSMMLVMHKTEPWSLIVVNVVFFWYKCSTLMWDEFFGTIWRLLIVILIDILTGKYTVISEKFLTWFHCCYFSSFYFCS